MQMSLILPISRTQDDCCWEEEQPQHQTKSTEQFKGARNGDLNSPELFSPCVTIRTALSFRHSFRQAKNNDLSRTRLGFVWTSPDDLLGKKSTVVWKVTTITQAQNTPKPIWATNTNHCRQPRERLRHNNLIFEHSSPLFPACSRSWSDPSLGNEEHQAIGVTFRASEKIDLVWLTPILWFLAFLAG